MAEGSAPVVAPAAASPKKGKKAAGGPKKPKSKPTHPPTSSMVNAAIKALKERGGSSLPAIKKYLAANYKVDVQKLAPFIKKYLKSAVTAGKLVQTKGSGASGSFKLPAKEKTEKAAKPKKAAAKKPKAAAKPKKAGEKKTAKPKKPAAAKKAATGAAKAAKKSGTVKSKAPKEKKAKAPKVAKKAPKPKKAAGATKKAAPKKAAAKNVVPLFVLAVSLRTVGTRKRLSNEFEADVSRFFGYEHSEENS
ncbi:histone H1-like isoform X1 [Hermetia illucens]|uniref:histone H1-like isoform X1 n=1 Tax=Hermetia illucens TaxID=343691 RepID=UPI0018CC713E|nr:histone H1-like isoform X1 [Hermetia illucens]